MIDLGQTKVTVDLLHSEQYLECFSVKEALNYMNEELKQENEKLKIEYKEKEEIVKYLCKKNHEKDQEHYELRVELSKRDEEIQTLKKQNGILSDKNETLNDENTRMGKAYLEMIETMKIDNEKIISKNFEILELKEQIKSLTERLELSSMSEKGERK